MSRVKVTVEGLEVTHSVAVFVAPKTAEEFRAVVEASGITEWRALGGGTYPATSVIGDLGDRIHLHLEAPSESRRPTPPPPPPASPFIAEFLAEVQS